MEEVNWWAYTCSHQARPVEAEAHESHGNTPDNPVIVSAL
jgi:hypothetical protein